MRETMDFIKKHGKAFLFLLLLHLLHDGIFSLSRSHFVSLDVKQDSMNQAFFVVLRSFRWLNKCKRNIMKVGRRNEYFFLHFDRSPLQDNLFRSNSMVIFIWLHVFWKHFYEIYPNLWWPIGSTLNFLASQVVSICWLDKRPSSLWCTNS